MRVIWCFVGTWVWPNPGHGQPVLELDLRPVSGQVQKRRFWRSDAPGTEECAERLPPRSFCRRSQCKRAPRQTRATGINHAACILYAYVLEPNGRGTGPLAICIVTTNSYRPGPTKRVFYPNPDHTPRGDSKDSSSLHPLRERSVFKSPERQTLPPVGSLAAERSRSGAVADHSRRPSLLRGGGGPLTQSPRLTELQNSTSSATKRTTAVGPTNPEPLATLNILREGTDLRNDRLSKTEAGGSLGRGDAPTPVVSTS